MAHEDQCSYPRCRHIYVVGLYGVIKLCQTHWSEYCKIELDDDSFAVHQVIRLERDKLKFQAKCGWRAAARRLEKLKADPEAYVLRHVNLGEGPVTVARHRELVEARRERLEEQARKAAEEEAAMDEFDDILGYMGEDDG